MVAWLAKCQPLLSAFADKRDVYSEFASQVYGKPVTRADIKERFVGKTAILGLGYGCGAAKFRHMLFIGNGGDSYKIELEEATRIVRSYRSTYVEVTELWNSMTLVIEQIIHTQDLMGIVHRATLGGLAASLPVQADNQSILLPNGMKLVYPNIRHYRSGGKIEVCYDDPYGLTQKLYGAKCLENVSQALARIIVTDIAVRVKHRLGLVPFLSTHDSLDYCVPKGVADKVDAMLLWEFASVPDWAKGLPLDSEGGWGVTLADAEKGVNQ
jgi:DNA polymerase